MSGGTFTFNTGTFFQQERTPLLKQGEIKMAKLLFMMEE